MSELSRRRDLGRRTPGATFNRPDWVMCGTQHGAGVMVIASKELTQAELEFKTDWADISMGLYVTALPTDRTLTLKTWLGRDTVMITGPDYPTVMAELFKTWSPASAPVRAIEAG